MQCFGDESGHFRNLLNGECDLFVIGVVAGDPIPCIACSKRAVRRSQSLEEAKWNGMTDVQKRRFIDCLAERDADLSLAYVAFSREDLHSLENNHHLYQNEILGVPPDIACIGLSYAELFGQVSDVSGPTDHQLIIDQFISKKQSEKICSIVERYQGDCLVQYESSHRTEGIQTADCFAGAVSETRESSKNWISSLNGVTDASDYALAHIEKVLTDI